MIRSGWILLLLVFCASRVEAQMGSMPAPQPPDTLTAVITGPQDAPVPRWSISLPDTLYFGQPIELTVEFPAGVSVHPDSIRSLTPWLLVKAPAELAAAEVLQLELRCWRAGPWRLTWDDQGESGVMWTNGRLGDGEAPDPVRDPWRPARDLRLLILISLVVTLVLATLVWLVLRRGRSGLEMEQGASPDPAWMTFAAALRSRIEAGHPTTNQTRSYLADLSRDVRTYLQRRYTMPAGGLTGGDVGQAMAAREYPATRADEFDAVLRDCDRYRFDPDPPGTDVCRRLTMTIIRAVEKDRTQRAASGFRASAALGAEADWNKLLETSRLWDKSTRVDSGEVER